MRAVIQRVSSARLTVEGELRGQIGRGLVVLVGVGRGDTSRDASWLASKILSLRIFEDETGRMNLDVEQAGGSVVLVSQFTLYADCRRGNRPGFTQAEEPSRARRLYEEFVALVREQVPSVVSGDFGAKMLVEIANDGPVTIILDTLAAHHGG